jgi:hypothetical protein
VALGSLSHRHRRSGFLVLQKGESEDESVKSKEHNRNPNPIGLGTYRITGIPDPPSLWTLGTGKRRQDLRATA